MTETNTTSGTHYGAFVTRAKIRPHDNADRLALCQIGAAQIVVGKDTIADGDLVLFFSADLQVSEEFAEAHDLVGYTDDVTGERKGGYFPKNRKVRPLRFRGERSDGYVVGLDHLDFTGGDTSTLTEGMLIQEFNGVAIATKYVNPHTRSARANGQQKARKSNPDFMKHLDTEQFLYYVGQIRPGSLITISAKRHGTSGRTGKFLEEVSLPRTWKDKLLRRTRTEKRWNALTGTRNVVLDGNPNAVGWYADESFRQKAVADWADMLHENETVYYELTGWAGPETPIMSPWDLTSSKDFKRWGKGQFDYGCVPGTLALHVYRITQVTHDALGTPLYVELSDAQMRKRCAELGLNPVTKLEQFIYEGDVRPEGDDVDGRDWETPVKDALVAKVVSLVEDDDRDFDSPHVIKEGVVLRIDCPSGRTWFVKHKKLTFRVAEGIVKERDDEVDREEVS